MYVLYNFFLMILFNRTAREASPSPITPGDSDQEWGGGMWPFPESDISRHTWQNQEYDTTDIKCHLSLDDIFEINGWLTNYPNKSTIVFSATTLNIFSLQTSSAERDQLIYWSTNIALSLLICIMLTIRRWADRPCGKGQKGVYQAIDIHGILYVQGNIRFRFIFALAVRGLF